MRINTDTGVMIPELLKSEVDRIAATAATVKAVNAISGNEVTTRLMEDLQTFVGSLNGENQYVPGSEDNESGESEGAETTDSNLEVAS